MKKYDRPEIREITIGAEDVIAASAVTQGALKAWEQQNNAQHSSINYNELIDF